MNKYVSYLFLYVLFYLLVENVESTFAFANIKRRTAQQPVKQL